MTKNSQSHSPLFSINVSSEGVEPVQDRDTSSQIVDLLQHLIASQERQNELLEDLVDQMGASQLQRAAELGQWRQDNPRLAAQCRMAAETLSKVQTEFLETMTEEIEESENSFADSSFMLNEFIDRFGPRLAHLNGVLQVLSQLSSVSDAPAPR